MPRPPSAALPAVRAVGVAVKYPAVKPVVAPMARPSRNFTEPLLKLRSLLFRRFESRPFQFSIVLWRRFPPRCNLPAMELTAVTYNTYRERAGRDPLLKCLMREPEALLCLQEVSPARALGMCSSLGRRVFLTPVKHGVQFLVLVIPEGARFLERRVVHLNSRGGLLPEPWCLRRGMNLRRAGTRGWTDALEPRAVQVACVAWRGRAMQVANTHLPYEPGLRRRCYTPLEGALDLEDAILAGDFNAVPEDLFFSDFLRATGLVSAGDPGPTHGGRRIDHILFRGRFRALGCGVERGRSDHLLVRSRLEVLP